MKSAKSGYERVLFLDGLRGVLALLVFIGHMDTAAGNVTGNSFIVSGLRVPAFFALSGFVQYLSSAHLDTIGMKSTFVEYFQRRARRLLPAYYASLLFAFLLCFTMDVFHLKRLPALDADFYSGLWSHLFLLQSWQEGHWFNGALWMMGYEWILSLSLPFILMLGNRIGWLPLLGGASLLLLPIMGPTWFWIAPNLTLPFLFGVVAARAARRLVPEQRMGVANPRTLALLLIFASFIAMLPFVEGMNVHVVHLDTVPAIMARVCAGLAVAAACVYLVWTPKSWLARGLSLPPITFLGRISYSFFLFHCMIMKPLAWSVERLGHVIHLPVIVFFLPTFPLSILAAMLCYRWFEEPFLRSGTKGGSASTVWSGFVQKIQALRPRSSGGIAILGNETPGEG